jgi:hypothetical protein
MLVHDVIGQLALLPTLRPLPSLRLPRAPNGISLDASIVAERLQQRPKRNWLLLRLARTLSPWQLYRATATMTTAESCALWGGKGYVISFLSVVAFSALLFVVIPYVAGAIARLVL